MFFKQKIHFRGILGVLGLILHIPAIMALASIPIALFFREYFAITPLFITALISIVLGQTLKIRFHEHTSLTLRDGMVTAACGWFISPLIGAIPFYWISTKLIFLGNDSSALHTLAQPINAFFEAFSGFSTTGLSMLSKPSELPHCLQWWRSLTEWIGSLGFMVFVISLLQSKSEDFQLYYAEIYQKKFAKNLLQTTRSIWSIYLGYTLLCIILFLIAGMPLWESINHGMCGIATGGFAITDDGFESYSHLVKAAALWVMVIGATSFAVYYKFIYKDEPNALWKDLQNRLFNILLIVGAVLTYFMSFGTLHFVDTTFQWYSALGTCGYNSVPVGNLTSMLKLFLMTAMVMGGCSGSTAGGLKIRRIIQIWRGLIIRLSTIMRAKAGETDYISHSIDLPNEKNTEMLYEATIHFALYIFTLFTAFFFLNVLNPQIDSLNILFDTTSALSNVGLSTGFITSTLSTPSKLIVMLTMVMGRLEIMPILVLFLSWPFSIGSKKKRLRTV